MALVLDRAVDRTTNMPRVIGQGSVCGHFGEILQGSFRDCDGAIVRALVTLRCPLFQAWALFEPTTGAEVTVVPSYCTKAKRAAENTLAYLGLYNHGGRLHIKSNAPIGIGVGSSTGDVVAAIRAVNEACRADMTPMEIAGLAVDTEIAIDPIMLRASPEIMFTHRNGTVLERFSRCLPPVRVLGFTDGEPVDTVAHPPARYDRLQIAAFEELRSQLRQAIDRGDTAGVGRVATHSAEINQAYLPKPSWPLLRDIMREAGAVGLAVSHSGSAVGLLFDPRWDGSDAGIACARRRLDEAGIRRRWHFLAGGLS